MHKALVLAGLLFLIVGSALAQDDFPKVETSPAFMYIRTSPNFTNAFLINGTPVTGSNYFNCAGGGGTIAVNFTKMLGLAADLGGCKFFGNTIGLGNTINGNQFTYLFGPRLTFRNHSPFVPFFELNFGGDRLSVSCKSSAVNCLTAAGGGTYSKSAFALTVGGGFDIKLSRKFSLRPVQAEYLYTRFGNDCALSVCNNNNNQNSFRLKSGIVVGWGGGPGLKPAASCSVQPSEVFVGEPIVATVAASNFNPKHTLTYGWSGNGGQITGRDTTAQIDTTNLAPRSYTVSARVTDATEKKNEASCWVNFTVKPLPPKYPPTLSISASPRNLQAGGTVTLSANCTSADKVGVSVANWTASGGTISGSGSSATLDTSGAPPGSIAIGATCTDTRGLSRQASTRVMIENPPPSVDKQLEARLALHSVYFVTDQPKPGDCKGGLLPSQQQTLISLAKDFKKYLERKPDAHLILGGHADVRGPKEYNLALSERRVSCTKTFLAEQGIPEASIDTKAFGEEHNLTDDEVRESVENNSELSPEERARILKNITTIRLASNRRVDVTLSTTGQTSVRQFPFNSTDALTLIGGREAAKKK